MKKVSILIAILTLLVSGAALAADFTTTDTTSIGGALFVPSANTTVRVVSGTTSYCSAAFNAQGDTAYASCGGTQTDKDSKILKKKCAAKCTATDIGSVTTTTIDGGFAQ